MKEASVAVDASFFYEDRFSYQTHPNLPFNNGRTVKK